MAISKTWLGILLFVLASQFDVSAAFQNGGITRTKAFAPRRTRGRPLEAAPFITELSSVYSFVMAKYYLATQSVTGGIICGLGDVLAQVQERVGRLEKENSFDFTRVDANSINFDRMFRFAIKGLGSGIIWAQWYGMADEWSLALSNDVLNMIGDDAAFGDGIHRVTRTVVSILLDQFVASPIIYSSWDLPFPMIMNGMPVESVPGRVKEKIGPLLVENAKVWTLFNVIIYNVPLEFRLLAMSTADVFWQSVIASVAAETAADNANDGEEATAAQNNAPELQSVTRLME